jgi:hypothetical protein
MVAIEINGFDETGEIGETIKIVRVGLNENDEWKPFIYNILHFGTLTLSKRNLKDQSDRAKKYYLQNVFMDQSFSINEYVIYPEIQLNLLKMLMISEFSHIFLKRLELIKILKSELPQEEIKKIISEVLSTTHKYNSPWIYTEACIKAYGHRIAVEDLKRVSKVFKNRSNDDLIISHIDGGFPFAFWGEAFQEKQEKLGESFDRYHTPIYGISHGDEYYPSINLAGSIAFITSTCPSASFPHRYTEIVERKDIPWDEFVLEYSKNCSSPRFFSRLFFIGNIPSDLQYLIPYLKHKEKNQIWEPFRIHESFESFYRKYRGVRKNDLVVIGNARNDDDKKLIEECKNLGLNNIEALSFTENATDFIDFVLSESKGTNLGARELSTIDIRLNQIKRRFKDYSK